MNPFYPFIVNIKIDKHYKMLWQHWVGNFTYFNIDVCASFSNKPAFLYYFNDRHMLFFWAFVFGCFYYILLLKCCCLADRAFLGSFAVNCSISAYLAYETFHFLSSLDFYGFYPPSAIHFSCPA